MLPSAHFHKGPVFRAGLRVSVGGPAPSRVRGGPRRDCRRLGGSLLYAGGGVGVGEHLIDAGPRKGGPSAGRGRTRRGQTVQLFERGVFRRGGLWDARESSTACSVGISRDASSTWHACISKYVKPTLEPRKTSVRGQVMVIIGALMSERVGLLSTSTRVGHARHLVIELLVLSPYPESFN
ncbi:hypothetical protein LX32DRAFT_342008 [Colletotrichum zoysiae]|uniref:Uncharacterized protein n=1 Tax=Colletotrichum zoysiae TaxID=1216348 RepID=A0AAD9HL05_9PEZI|nr:hypothetical protein LX32DRAFT_342008 [Colletotrichum zoysiae]